MIEGRFVRMLSGRPLGNRNRRRVHRGYDRIETWSEGGRKRPYATDRNMTTRATRESCYSRAVIGVMRSAATRTILAAAARRRGIAKIAEPQEGDRQGCETHHQRASNQAKEARGHLSSV